MFVNPAIARELRSLLITSGFTVDGIAERLGARAFAALRAEQEWAARLQLAGSEDRLATLIRLFMLADPVPARLVPAEVPIDLLRASGDEVSAVLDLRPHSTDGDQLWWVASDIGLHHHGHRDADEYVTGIGGASLTMARAMLPGPVERALDLGTGSGVLALHLGTRAHRVTATDLSPRAVALAELTFALSQVEIDCRRGDLFAPVAADRFDLIVSNPPFVISPDGGYTYRDAGLPADSLAEALVRAAPARLTPGGCCQLLANWLNPATGSWTDRVEPWFAGTGLSAWIVQREVLDPVAYVAMWMRDSGEDRLPDADRRRERWLRYFDEQGAEAIGFGLISARRDDASVEYLRLEDLSAAPAAPTGDDVAAWFAGRDQLRQFDSIDSLAAARLVPATGLTVTEAATFAADQFAPPRYWLAAPSAARPATPVNSLLAGLLRASDGRRQVLQTLAGIVEEPGSEFAEYAPYELVAMLAPALRLLIEQGSLLVTDSPG